MLPDRIAAPTVERMLCQNIPAKAHRTAPERSAVPRWTSGASEVTMGPQHEASQLPWHFLYFLPLPHGHMSFRPALESVIAFTPASEPIV